MSGNKLYRSDVSRWSVERIMFAFGGTLIAVCSLLAIFVHPGFSYGALFVGSMLVFFALTGYCPMAMLVDRLMKK